MGIQTAISNKNAMYRGHSAFAAMGVTRSHGYDLISKGLLTAPIKAGIKVSLWPVDEIDQINAARIRGDSDDEIRALVNRLHGGSEAIRIITERFFERDFKAVFPEAWAIDTEGNWILCYQKGEKGE